MTEEEYKIIKEGIISLLCVGDKVYYIYRRIENVYNYDSKWTTQVHYVIRECTITHICDNIIQIESLQLGTKAPQCFDLEFVEMYDGRLYRYPVLDDKNSLQRLVDVTNIIESEDTEFE